MVQLIYLKKTDICYFTEEWNENTWEIANNGKPDRKERNSPVVFLREDSETVIRFLFPEITSELRNDMLDIVKKKMTVIL